MDTRPKAPTRLKNLRRLRGYSRRQFAALADISVQHLTNLENGDNRPSLDMARKIAAALELSVDEAFPSPHGGSRVFVAGGGRGQAA